MKHKILSIDLDGTLLTLTKKITLKDKQALAKYIANGGIAFINTGRPLVSAAYYMNEVNDHSKMKMQYLSAFNGAYIKDFKNDKTYENPINSELAKELYDFIVVSQLTGWFYTTTSLEKGLVESTKKNNSIAKHLVKKFKMIDVVPVDISKNLSSYKINIFSNSYKKLEKIYKELIGKYKDKLTITFTTSRIIEITAKGIDKAYAIDLVCKLEKCKKENVMSLGDSKNDLAAFQNSDLAIAIKPKNKELSQYVNAIIYVKKNAVAEAIENFIFNPNEYNSYIKLIVSDLDGTLLEQKSKQISFETEKAIQTCVNDFNVPFCIATGRNVYDALKVMKSLKLSKKTPLFIISNNGAIVFDVNKENYISINQINYETSAKVFDFLKKANTSENNNISILIYQKNNELLCFNTSDKSKYLNSDPWISVKPTVIEQLPENSYNKFVVSFANNQIAQKYFKEAKKTFPKLEITQSADDNIEINAQNVSKGEGLKQLCKHLNIESKNSMVFGDHLNDVSMLQLTNYSFAPTDSVHGVKQTAKHVIDNEKNNFVGVGINKFFLHIIDAKKDL